MFIKLLSFLPVMPLSSVSPGDFERVAEELARYWKERGMDVYDKEWALQYLVRGHALDVVSDRFFSLQK